MKKQDKFFIRLLLLSTVLVITVVTIMAFSVYSYSSGKIKSSMADVSIELLNQVESFADTYVFKRAEVFAAQNFMAFNEDSDISKIYSKEPLESSFLYRYYSELSSKVNLTDFINGVHIYVPHRNMIISSDNICSLDDGNKPTGFTYEKRTIFERALAGEKWISTYTNTNGDNVITLIVKYSPYDAAVPVGVIAVDILEESIQSAFEDFKSDRKSNVIIVDEQGKILSSADKSMLFEDVSGERYINKVLESEERQGYFISRINGRKQLVTYIKSDSRAYMGMQEIGQVFGANRFLLIFILIISVLVILIGFVGAYMISNNYYTSVRSLAELVSGSYNESNTNDVLVFLKDAFYGMSDDVSRYKRLKNDIVPVARNNFAYYITHNRETDPEYIKKQYEILGIDDKNCGVFAVMSCCINGIDSQTDAYFEYGLAEYIYSFGDEERTILCTGGGTLPLTVIVSAKSREKMRIRALAEAVRKNFLDLKIEEYTIFVGEEVDDISEVAKCYEALKSLEKYSFVLTGAHIIEYRDLLVREQSAAKLEHTALFGALSDAMDRKNVNDTVMCISDMITTLKRGNFSYDYIQEFLFHLLEHVSLYMKTKRIETDETGVDKEALYDEYRRAKNIDSIMGFIQDICVNIVRMNNDDGRENEISDKVIEFVKSLPDEEMKEVTLLYVADRLFLSQAYISRTFKNETGERFIDWLTNEKLERCAGILKNKSIKIKDVCDIMGYSNSNYFIRKFKEKYGITPKQYQSRNE